MKKFRNIFANAIYILASFAACILIFNFDQDGHITAWLHQYGPSPHNMLIIMFCAFLFVAAANLIRIAWGALKKAHKDEEKHVGYNFICIVAFLTLAIGYFCYLKLV